MQVNDYWRKIIGEIIVLKHGSSGEDDSILVGGGGGMARLILVGSKEMK